jgi:CDP-4-dehydro-6-deoxyglucose reductase
VSLANSDRGFSVAAGESLLAAALSAGLDLPHGCQGGNCGACRARLQGGEVHYPNGRPLGLSDAETDAGFILLCQARAAGDLVVEIIEQKPRESALVKRLPARIERSVRLAHDVLAVFLRLPAAEPLPFDAGQYIDVLLPRGRRRSFSIASPPHESRCLELHVRRVAGGEFTEPLFANSAAGTLLSIEGPLGRFGYHAGARPMLLVGGGTGLAPLKSIIRHVLETEQRRDMTLYWGVRSEADLYAHEELTELARRVPAFRYHAVLSEPSPPWRGLRGWVHEAVLRGAGERPVPPLAAADIYASGPPAMIAALRREFVTRGADAARLFVESFDYAPDTCERQRSSAATKP